VTGETSWWAAGLMGFFGSVHCVVMCGGIVGALGEALPRRGTPQLLLHHLGYSAGRIASYACAGALAGASGLLLADLLGRGGALLLRLLCGALLVAAGVWIAGGWAGITRLEALGAPLWRRLAPLSRQLAPADRLWKLGVLGAIWGWLPCGLVYAALGAAATSGSAATGALWMTAFGLGTLPALLAVGAFSVGLQRIREGRGTRRLAGALLVAFGLWTALGAALPGHGDREPGHDPHAHPAQARARADTGADSDLRLAANPVAAC